MADRNTVKNQTIDRLAEKIMQEPYFGALIDEQKKISEEEVRKLARMVAEEVVTQQLTDKTNIENWAKDDIVTKRIKSQFNDHIGHDRFKKPLTDHIYFVLGHLTAHKQLKGFIDSRIQNKMKEDYGQVVDERARYIFQNESVKNYKLWLPIAVSVLFSILSLVVALRAR